MARCIFLKPGAKNYGDCYYTAVLKQMLLPDIWTISGNHFMLQRDCVAAQNTRDTVQLL